MKASRPPLDPFPPSDENVEQGLLSCMLRDNRVIDEMRHRVSPDDFYQGIHQLLCEIIYALYDRQHGGGIDLITVSAELKKRNVDQELGHWNYLATVMESTEHTAHAQYYANIILQKSQQRQLDRVLRDLLREVAQPADPETLLEHCETAILQVRDRYAPTTVQPLKYGLLALLERADAWSNGTAERWYTGIPDLDSLVRLGGGNVIVIGSRTSVGKSTLGIQLAVQISRHASARDHVYLVSMEMNHAEIAARVVSAFENVTSDVANVERGLNVLEAKQLNTAVSNLIDTPVHVNDAPRQSIAMIAANARRLHWKHRLGLIVVDYLQLIATEPSRNKTRSEVLGEVSKGLKQLAKELDCPVIALSQLNREADDAEEPMLCHLRESGCLEQDADSVMLLWNPSGTPSDPNADALVNLKVAKNRQGPVGTIRLLHRKEFMRFEEEPLREIPV